MQERPFDVADDFRDRAVYRLPMARVILGRDDVAVQAAKIEQRFVVRAGIVFVAEVRAEDLHALFLGNFIRGFLRRETGFALAALVQRARYLSHQRTPVKRGSARASSTAV